MSKRLLVVDDEKSITQIIGRIAVDVGYDVLALNDPTQTLDAIRDFRPDILMIDMIMPEIDGVDVLRQVATLGFDVRIIVMSGFGTGYLRLAQAVAAFEARPAISQLAKPFRRADLVAVLDEQLPAPKAQPMFGIGQALPEWMTA